MPEEFLSFCLSFVADDQIIYKTQFAYGADLSNIELPKIPERDGSYGRWEDTEYSHMVFDTIVEAIYENHITALESAQKKNDLAVLLVEGRFDSDQQLHLTTKTIDSADIAENDRLLECWNLIIPEEILLIVCSILFLKTFPVQRLNIRQQLAGRKQTLTKMESTWYGTLMEQRLYSAV